MFAKQTEVVQKNKNLKWAIYNSALSCNMGLILTIKRKNMSCYIFRDNRSKNWNLRVNQVRVVLKLQIEKVYLERKNKSEWGR